MTAMTPDLKQAYAIWDTHHWVEHPEGWLQCKHCRQIWPSMAPIMLGHVTACPGTPLITVVNTGTTSTVSSEDQAFAAAVRRRERLVRYQRRTKISWKIRVGLVALGVSWGAIYALVGLCRAVRAGMMR